MTESAAAATELYSGFKTNLGIVGYNGSAIRDDVDSVRDLLRMETILDWAQEEGMATGAVTNTRPTHATIAALYGSVVNRKWECDSKAPDGVKDLARQLVEDAPGKNLRVVLGGGRGAFGNLEPEDVVNQWACQRKDGRNLVQEWLSKAEKSAYVKNKEEFLAVDANETDRLLGLFAANSFSFVSEHLKNSSQPSLPEMAAKAVQVLSKGDKGFFLLIESGLIDSAHHMNWATKALEETLEFDETVSKVVDMIDTKETLVILTSDHSHALSISGTTSTGPEGDIRGLSEPSTETHGHRIPVLTYANGPGKMNESNSRNMTDSQFRHPSLTELWTSAHSGEDVPIYATGNVY